MEFDVEYRVKVEGAVRIEAKTMAEAKRIVLAMGHDDLIEIAPNKRTTIDHFLTQLRAKRAAGYTKTDRGDWVKDEGADSTKEKSA